MRFPDVEKFLVNGAQRIRRASVVVRLHDQELGVARAVAGSKCVLTGCSGRCTAAVPKVVGSLVDVGLIAAVDYERMIGLGLGARTKLLAVAFVVMVVVGVPAPTLLRGGLDVDAVEDLTRRIAESRRAYYAQGDLALFLRGIASRVMVRRVQREAGLTSSTRKE